MEKLIQDPKLIIISEEASKHLKGGGVIVTIENLEADVD